MEDVIAALATGTGSVVILWTSCLASTSPTIVCTIIEAVVVLDDDDLQHILGLASGVLRLANVRSLVRF